MHREEKPETERPPVWLDRSEPVLAVIGPSGTGKSSVVRELRDRGLIEITPTWTTRPRRTGEDESDLNHVFVSEAEFARQERDRFFLGTATLFGLPYRYGVPRLRKPPPGQVPVLLLRAAAIGPLPELYPNYLIYQIEDDAKRVAERLREREQAGEDLGRRLADYASEITSGARLASRRFENRTTVEALAEEIAITMRQDFPRYFGS